MIDNKATSGKRKSESVMQVVDSFIEEALEVGVDDIGGKLTNRDGLSIK